MLKHQTWLDDVRLTTLSFYWHKFYLARPWCSLWLAVFVLMFHTGLGNHFKEQYNPELHVFSSFGINFYLPISVPLPSPRCVSGLRKKSARESDKLPAKDQAPIPRRPDPPAYSHYLFSGPEMQRGEKPRPRLGSGGG